MKAETICAIATPPGLGGVGIVRISGPDAQRILKRVCPKISDDLASHRLVLSQVTVGSEVLDEVLVSVMKGPHSYTGEDVVEINGHGGALNMRRLLEAVCAAGARPAAPGEFTQRAFLNGRLDLTQAEAVADIIHADSQMALELAQHHLAGRLGALVDQMREGLLVAVTLTEAAIDFSTEEHVYQLDAEQLSRQLSSLQAQIRKLLGTWDAGRQTRQGVKVVIVGRPNAGKSTLFNRLCCQERAIVTEVPGTTRDYLEESVSVDGLPLRLVDTAGLRDALDTVERIGVDRALEQARQADLILWLVDASAAAALDPAEIDCVSQAQEGGADVVAIFNKSDLPSAITDAEVAQVEATAGQPLWTSLLGEELGADLTRRIAEVVRRRLKPASEGAAITRQRHRDALSRALEAIEKATAAVEMSMSHEFIALDLRLALDAVGEITGRVTVDDVLHRIFSSFCVGK